MKIASYLAGLVCADGHLDSGEKSVSIYSNNKPFSEMVRGFLKEETGKNAKIYASKNAYKIYCYCPVFYNFLLDEYGLFAGRKSHRIVFPENLSLEDKKNFLMGYADGDGGVYVDGRRRRGKVDYYLRVELASKNRRFLEGVKRFLNEIGVTSGEIMSGLRAFRLRIYGKNATKFVDSIGFRHPQKIPLFLKPQGVDRLQILDTNSQKVF